MRCALFVGLAAALFFVTGCGGGDSSTTTASNTSSSAAPPPPPGAPAAPAAGGAAASGGAPAPGGAAAPGGMSSQMPSVGGMPGGSVPGGMPGGAMPGGMPGGAMPGGMPGGAMPGGLAGGGMPGMGMPGMGMPGMGLGGAARSAPPKSLREQAMDAFRRGDDRTGFQLLYTHFAIIPSAGAELAEKMAWNPGLRRPALGPRFAIGAVYNPPAEFDSSPQPIGSKEAEEALASLNPASSEGSGSGEKKSRRFGDKRRQQQGGAGGAAAGGLGAPGAIVPGGAGPGALGPGGMPGMPGEGGQNSGPGDQPSDELAFYTGEYGTQLLDAIQSRLASGDYGLVMRDLMTEARQPAQRKNQQAGGLGMPGAMPGGLGAMPGGMPGGAPPGAGAAVGGIADPGGMPMPGVAGGEGDAGEGNQGPGGDAGDENAGPGSLAPAVVWLGTGRSKDELLRAATRANADVLVSFEITVRVATKNTFVNNTTKVRVSTVKKDELLINTAGLNNRDVHLAREKGLKGEDPVEKDVARIVEALDKAFTTTELPAAITPERALARVQSLVAQTPDDPLAVIVETRFYAEKGLLKQEDVLTIASQALGEEKFAELLARLPGAGAGQMLGGSVGLGGLLGLMRGVNSATDAAKNAGSGSGLSGLIPTGLPIPGLAGGQPAGGFPAGEGNSADDGSNIPDSGIPADGGLPQPGAAVPQPGGSPNPGAVGPGGLPNPGAATPGGQPGALPNPGAATP